MAVKNSGASYCMSYPLSNINNAVIQYRLLNEGIVFAHILCFSGRVIKSIKIVITGELISNEYPGQTAVIPHSPGLRMLVIRRTAPVRELGTYHQLKIRKQRTSS
jgi:hypothetical protein